MVTGISTDNIALNATFDGSELFVFGAIRRDAPTPPDAGPLDVIITIKGPPASVTGPPQGAPLRHLDEHRLARVRQAPSFYAVATTRPLDDILSETERLRYQIGMDQAVRRVGGHDTIDDTTAFTDALVRLREQTGTYQQLDDGDLHRRGHAVPDPHRHAGEPRRGRLRGRSSSWCATARSSPPARRTIRVEKTGIERWLYNLSRNRPLLYGLASVAARPRRRLARRRRPSASRAR